jgi:hypothetical protein
MADRDKYVDIFFRNGLKEYEVLPPPDVWESIKPALIKREKSLTFMRVAAVAAILVSLSAFSVWLTKNLSDNFSSLSFSFNPEVLPAGTYVARSLPLNGRLTQVPDKISKRAMPVAVEEKRSSEQIFLKMPNNGLFSTSLKDSKLSKSIDPVITTSGIIQNSNLPGNISLTLAQANSVQENPVVAVNRWTMSAMASPNYYSRFSYGTDQAATDLASNEKPDLSYAGGMAFAYKVNKRISVQSGVYYSSIGQNVSGISTYSGFSKYNGAKGSSQFSIQTSRGTIVATNSNIYLRDDLATRVITGYFAQSIDPAKANLTPLNNSISQNFRYLEIPVLLKYKAIDRKIDINLIGGLSYNMLVGNSASANVDGVKYSIGETEGLSPVNFSSSLGLGFEYSLSRKISFNLEPTFRYYLTPLGGQLGSSIHPYSFGVFTGVSYKF